MDKNKGFFILMSSIVVVTIFWSCNKPGSSLDPINQPLPTFSPLPSPSNSPVVSPTLAPSPVASASPEPSICPCLSRWSIGQSPLNLMDANHNPVSTYQSGGWAIFDSTPKFAAFDGDLRGQPDNADHPNFGGICEDPSGGLFSAVQSPSAWQPNPSNAFMLKVGPLVRGSHTFKVGPKIDLQDSLGRPVEVCKWVKDPTTSVTFSF